MTNDGVETAAEVDEAYPAQPVSGPAWWSALAWCLRALARVWVVGLLIFSAAFAGIGAYKAYETRAELAEIRKAPGPQAYAVVAYRRELARQIRAYGRHWRDPDAVPEPPERPRLLYEIDNARQRSAELNAPPPRPSRGGLRP
jgi:hypothetical protein